MPTLNFRVHQAEPQIQFRGNPDALTGSDAIWWSMPSFHVGDETTIDSLERNGGRWRGTVQILPDGAFNMMATYTPDEGAPDSLQFLGIVRKDLPVSHVALVGGTGKYAGARGQAKSGVAMSDRGTPLFTYEISYEI